MGEPWCGSQDSLSGIPVRKAVPGAGEFEGGGRGCASGFVGYKNPTKFVLLVTQEVTLQDVSFDVPPPASGSSSSCDSSLEVLQVTKKELPAALPAVVFIC